MCTAAADICKPVLCNKQFGKMHSLSSILTLLLVFLTIVAWKMGPNPTVLRGGSGGIEEEVSGETMSETKPLHSRNVREIRWCPTKEPVKPLGCQVTLPKTRMEPEDKPKDQEGCDQDHLEGQAQRQMLVTSSPSYRYCYYRRELSILPLQMRRTV